MKIYCSVCDTVQPVIVTNERDVKTGEPFQDIMCSVCDLVIASGQDIQSRSKHPETTIPLSVSEYKAFKLGWLECEAAHGIK